MFQVINLGVRFFLEIGVLIVFAWLGWNRGNGLGTKVTLAVSLTLVVMTLWSLFGSPKAPFPLEDGYQILLELGIFGIAVIGLYLGGKPILAIVFASIIIINRLLMFIWGQ